tara:strand:- start:2134 stop:3309 length:1176 start_codon:yes stop_codon:yes gene_type:complete
MQNNYDIVVVGGGPGGSMSALHAAKNGMSVCMLEKTRDIGYPVRCGEALGEQAIKQFFEPKESWIASRIKRCRLVSPSGIKVNIPFNKEQGYVLNRRVFDYDLSLMAASEGAEIYTKCYVNFIEKTSDGYKIFVEYLGDTKIITAKIVIGADGVDSRVGKWAGIKTMVKMKDMESCVQYSVGNIDLDVNRMDMYLGHSVAPGGYLWVFPKGEGFANIGIGVSGKYSKEKSAKQYIDQFIKEKYPSATIHTTMCGGVPCAKPIKEPISEGLMLVGDAAHFVNPMTGGGIAAAMKSGMFAGKVASDSIKNNDTSIKFLNQYIKLCNKDFTNRHDRIYAVKETIQKLSDDELNAIASKVSEIPSEKISLAKVFTAAIMKKPSLVVDVMRMFAGF